MKRLPLFILLFAASLTFITSCKKDDEPETKDIVETAMDSEQLSSLVSALDQAGLAGTLKGDGPFTVFAPTNAAFQDLLDSNADWNELSDIDNATLSSVLLFHVLSGSVMSADLSTTYVPTQSTGPNSESLSLRIDVGTTVTLNASAMPTTTDVEATNGVVHIIDKVMLPPNVVDHASNNSMFSTLVAALTRSDLSTDYVTTLTGDGPFTVFAPTNAAFEDLLNSNPDWNTLNDIPVATLEAVLNYHVVSGANVQSDELSNGQTVSTLNGDLTVDLSDGAKLSTTSGQSVTISLTDVQGTNGVVHVVDQVLVP